MRKYRLMYAGLLIFTLAVLIAFGDTYLFAMLVIEILVPVLLCILLGIEASGTTVELDMTGSCVAGEKSIIHMNIDSRIPFAAAGKISADITFANALLGSTTRKELQITGIRNAGAYKISFEPVSCGEVQILCDNVIFYDVLGISRVRIKRPVNRILEVLPKSVPLELIRKNNVIGSSGEEQLNYYKKGNDNSEIYDLRDYRDGDDVRSIHWKLSEKLDKLIVKEAGDSSNYGVLVLFDGGLGCDGKRYDEELVAGFMDFSVTFTRKLLELQQAHYIAAVMKDRLVLSQIETADDLAQHVHRNMGVALPETTGGVLDAYTMGELQGGFSKVIYIVDGEIPDMLYQSAENLADIAICITDKREDICTTRKGKCTFVEVPVKNLYTQSHYIYV